MAKSAFSSTHNLIFESCPYEKDLEWFRFRIGTMHGLWRATADAYEVLAVDNHEPGNGHFQDFFDWFENSCKRDGKKLVALQVLEPDLKKHLITKRGFTSDGEHCTKTFK